MIFHKESWEAIHGNEQGCFEKFSTLLMILLRRIFYCKHFESLSRFILLCWPSKSGKHTVSLRCKHVCCMQSVCEGRILFCPWPLCRKLGNFKSINAADRGWSCFPHTFWRSKYAWRHHIQLTKLSPIIATIQPTKVMPQPHLFVFWECFKHPTKKPGGRFHPWLAGGPFGHQSAWLPTGFVLFLRGGWGGEPWSIGGVGFLWKWAGPQKERLVFQRNPFSGANC